MKRSRTTLRRTAARLAPATASLLLLAGSLAACSADDAPGPTASGADPCASLAAYGEFPEGTTVTIATAFTGTEAERFDASLEQFEQCTGIDVVQDGSDGLEVLLRRILDGSGADSTAAADEQAEESANSSLPDLAVVPQPGLVADLARSGALAALPDPVGANVELGWDRSWMDVGSVDGVLYAAPIMASVKSFVWYSPVAFAQAGYEVPTTWEELVELTERIVADNAGEATGDGESDAAAETAGGPTPWCLGISDGDSTGWPMSDWLEETLLATAGVGAYDAWTSHGVALDDASAVTALDTVGKLLLADGRVPGGGEQAATTTVEAAGEQLVAGSCLMLHASSNYENLLPADTDIVAVDAAAAEHSGTGSATAADAASDGATDDTASSTATSAAGEDGQSEDDAAEAGQSQATASTGGVVSAFLIPGASGDEAGSPVIVGGDFLVSLAATSSQSGDVGDVPEEPDAAEAVMTYLTSAEWAQTRVELGGMATAHRGVDASDMSSDVARRATLLLQSRQSVIRFDASDSMPSDVGTDVLWGALTTWTTGELDSKEALAEAEAAWPR
ncbi:ABC transporter substrate-binding protein [Actinomyces sp. MRS3W]|uniref:ABC transporter substrate-binding protein n=1 Tax=Actinomyces sp. MRS3W TaxID=2800796 RepID=UPI0028FD1D13|nr:ABC transporter substrate-binding protein [Actinomyces sp. MRS3W]MDU0347859.1 ABC transporter substrate-binding protein [Actinomyces sp. MRS3W]